MAEIKQTIKDQEKAQDFLARLSGDMRWSQQLPHPDNLTRLREELHSDLLEVPVVAEDGQVTNVFQKIDIDNVLPSSDKELIWNCLAIVRDMFWRLEQAPDNPVPGYQWNMNWKHTRAEVDQVYDAAKLLGLSPKETRDALLASIFSDAIKSRSNFIVHNVHGAEASVQVLSYFLDSSKSSDRKSIERVARACREHQIAPPTFMATVVAIMIHNKNELGRFIPGGAITSGDKNAEAAKSIFSKIQNPFEVENLSEDLQRIDFNERERELLQTIGIEEWYVPYPSDPGSKIGHAVIAGDHSINYNNPEGFAKIALLRGPDTESIFEDPTIYHSLESAVSSFTDSFRVIRPEVQSLAISGLRRTKGAIARVTSVMAELFNGIIVGPRSENMHISGHESIERAIARAHEKHPNLYRADSHSLSDASRQKVDQALERVGALMEEWYRTWGEIPFNPKGVSGIDTPGPGSLPFWNTALKYPARDREGRLVLDSLSELELRQYRFADRIREIVVELLRAEQWIYTSED
ncbi:MAG: hypothetical protein K2Z81_27860 [Cyanobacteria bacterium]|nr:hypothetical protein [Cyanobacteriota bacterium]